MTATTVRYFAYGSNMSLARLRARVPSAQPLGHHLLRAHDLRFHKAGQDGSGKCDAFPTGNHRDTVHGVLFEIDSQEKTVLDRIEGVGHGYRETDVVVWNGAGTGVDATTYTALRTDPGLQPYDWYLQHVMVGAREAALPRDYVETRISSTGSLRDPDRARDLRERLVYG